MGTGAEFWVPALISAVSAGAGVYQTQKVADDQDAAAAQGIRQQAARQREVDARLNEEIGALEQSSPEAERQKALDGYLAQLRSSRGVAAGAATPGGEQFKADTATTNAGVQNFGQKVAGTLARIRAPQFQRQNEGFGFARAGGTVADISRTASGEDFLNRLRVSGIQRDPWIDAAGELGQGVASGMAGRAPSGGLEEIDITAQRIPTAGRGAPLARSPWGGGYNYTNRSQPFVRS